jgi:hypothetical protein
MSVGSTQQTNTTTKTSQISQVSNVVKSDSSTNTKPAETQSAQQQQGGSGSNLGGFISSLFQTVFSAVLKVATASFGGPVMSALTGFFGLKTDNKNV